MHLYWIEQQQTTGHWIALPTSFTTDMELATKTYDRYRSVNPAEGSESPAFRTAYRLLKVAAEVVATGY